MPMNPTLMRLTFIINYPKYDKPAKKTNREKIAMGAKISSSSPSSLMPATIPSINSYPASPPTTITIIPKIIYSTLNPPKFCIK